MLVMTRESQGARVAETALAPSARPPRVEEPSDGVLVVAADSAAISAEARHPLGDMVPGARYRVGFHTAQPSGGDPVTALIEGVYRDGRLLAADKTSHDLATAVSAELLSTPEECATKRSRAETPASPA